MPTFGHIFYGLAVLIPLFYLTKNKFNYKVAFIFLANQIYGPDIVGYLFITPFHSILGFLIIGIPYSLVFTYASRFSLIKSDKGFPLKLEDSGIREINWKNAYLITAAGGFSHFFIDNFFHWETEMTLWSNWPDWIITLDDLFALSGVPYHVATPLMIVGEVIVIITIILSLYFLRKGYKETAKLFAIYTALSVILMIVSPLFFGGEREYAVLIAISIYIFLPFIVLVYVVRDVQDHPIETKDEPKIERAKLTNIVGIIGILVAFFLILYASLAIFMTDIVAGLIGGTPDLLGIQIIGIVYGSVALMLLIGSIGLFLKINFFRYLAIISSLYLMIFGFPIAIAFFLCEGRVKELFRK